MIKLYLPEDFSESDTNPGLPCCTIVGPMLQARPPATAAPQLAEGTDSEAEAAPAPTRAEFVPRHEPELDPPLIIVPNSTITVWPPDPPAGVDDFEHLYDEEIVDDPDAPQPQSKGRTK